MEHELKILPQYFKAVKEGTKTFEIRKNDRGFKVGDKLLLKEWSKFDNPVDGYAKGFYTGQEITKEVSYILEGGQYGLEEGYCILGLKGEGIKLQNIDLNNVTLKEQIEKVKEEDRELKEALINSDNEDIISEFWDCVQVRIGILEKHGIRAEEIMKGYPLHLEKIKLRPRQKLCSKCIKCEKIKIKEQGNINKLFCHKNNTGTIENNAKECKSYEESEE